MKLIKTVFVLFLFIAKVHATTYYVDTNSGDDNNSGTEANPWETIQKASDMLSAGDTVLIRDGVYYEQVIVSNSGNDGNYITYMAYPGETVAIDGSNTNFTDGHTAIFLINNKSYIKVIGIEVRNIGTDYDSSYDQAGFMIELSDHITIQNCSTYNTFSSGIIAAYSNDLLIDGNSIRLACNGGEQECISMSYETYNFEIKNNEIFDGGPGTKGGEGIDAKAGAHDGTIHHNYVHDIPFRLGVYVDSYENHTYNIDIYNNTVHNCSDGGMALSSESGGLLENINIYNNVSYNNAYYGIIISNWDGDLTQAHPMKDISVMNNTLYNNTGAGVNWGGGIIMSNLHAENVIIRNNICVDNNVQILVNSGVDTSELTVDNNLIYGDQDFYGSNYIEADPMFTDPDNGDFHLQEGSPAIDAGSSNTAPDTDLDDNSRPLGNGWDLGAYEFNATLATESINLDSAITVYPNPFKEEATLTLSAENKSYVVKIYNTLGKLVKTISGVSTNSININREGLTNGIYFMQVQQGKQVFAKEKLILK